MFTINLKDEFGEHFRTVKLSVVPVVGSVLKYQSLNESGKSVNTYAVVERFLCHDIDNDVVPTCVDPLSYIALPVGIVGLPVPVTIYPLPPNP